MLTSNFLRTNYPIITPDSLGPTDNDITPKTFAVYNNLVAGWYGVRFTYV